MINNSCFKCGYLFLLLCFFDIAINNCHAQYVGDSLSLANNYLFKKNHFALELENGLLKGKLDVKAGNPNYAPNSTTSFFHLLGFNYAFNHSDKFSTSVRLGFGYFPAYYRMKNEGYYLFKYWENISGSEFANLSLGFEYRKKLNNKNTSYIKSSLSAYLFNNVRTNIGGTSVVNNRDTVQSTVNFLFKNKQNIAAEILVGNYYKLSNHNLFKYGLKLNYALSNFYTGIFYNDLKGSNQFAAGTISNSNIFLSIQLSYVFSKSSKQAIIFDLKNQHPDKSSLEIKRLYKQHNRLQTSKNNLLIALNTGLNLQPNHVNDANFNFRNTTSLSAALQLEAAYLFSNTNFAEASIGRLAYYEGNSNRIIEGYDCFICGSHSNAFDALQLKIGLGKRVLNKKKYNIINLHAGVSLVNAFASLGISGKGYSTALSNNDTLLTETHISYQLKKIFPMVYLGISKDIKISPVLFIRFQYQSHIGFYPVFESKYTYQTNSMIGKKFATYHTNGSFQTFQFGIVYKLEL